jgi:hypothetical protein
MAEVLMSRMTTSAGWTSCNRNWTGVGSYRYYGINDVIFIIVDLTTIGIKGRDTLCFTI